MIRKDQREATWIVFLTTWFHPLLFQQYALVKVQTYSVAEKWYVQETLVTLNPASEDRESVWNARY
jgi:hypothetical protein